MESSKHAKYTTTNAAIARWLAADDLNYEQLLSECSIQHDANTGELRIDCCSEELLIRIAERSQKTARPAIKLAVRFINLSCQGQARFRFTPDLALRYSEMLTNPPIIETIDTLLIKQIPEPKNPIAIVRMSDHIGILGGNRAREHSGVDRQQWEGQDMSRWWIDDHLKRFTDSLMEHGEVQGFSYRALLMTGEPRRFTVNAWLIRFGKDICRMVETLNCEPD